MLVEICHTAYQEAGYISRINDQHDSRLHENGETYDDVSVIVLTTKYHPLVSLALYVSENQPVLTGKQVLTILYQQSRDRSPRARYRVSPQKNMPSPTSHRILYQRQFQICGRVTQSLSPYMSLDSGEGTDSSCGIRMRSEMRQTIRVVD